MMVVFGGCKSNEGYWNNALSYYANVKKSRSDQLYLCFQKRKIITFAH